MRPKTPRKNIGKIIFDINGSNIFLDQNPKAKKKKKKKRNAKIKKWDLIKLKTFNTTRETINLMKR